MFIKLVNNNKEIVFLITAIEIYLLNVSATISNLHHELNYKIQFLMKATSSSQNVE